MHGHNHNFEVINRDDMLFVSNGRIGGFDPSKGKYGIGGVYFEITKDKLIVKCYSAEKDMFLDSFDVSLSQTLDVKTTFDNKADFAYSYGVGGAVNGERIPAYHHHVGENTKSELFLTGCNSAIINDDHAMTKYTERKAYHGLDKILFAAKVNHGNAGFEYTNPGIRLKANDNWWTTLTMPSDNYDKYSYYRCPLGQKYEASIDLDVKGIKGIGPKGASKVLDNSTNHFLSVCREYKNAYKGRWKDQIRLNYLMLKLRDDARPCKDFEKVEFD